MKRTMIFAISMLVATFAFGQKQDLDEFKVTAPMYGSVHYETLDEFLTTAIEYPADAKKIGLQGTVVVGFTVTPEGKIKDFEIVNSVCHSLNNEVIRALAVTDGKWSPGTVESEPMEMYREISVVFQTSANTDFIALARDCIAKGNDLMFYKNQPKKALRYFDKGITLLPNEEALLTSRSLCLYNMGDINGAEKDWARIKLLTQNNETETNFELAKNYELLEGYEKMLNVLAK